jgi:uncharacterized phage infection (PIP) family protein YhgE
MDASLIVAAVVGLAGVVVIFLAIQKIAALTKIIENLSSDLPGTYMTAKELATEISSAFESASQKQQAAMEKISGTLSEAAVGLTSGTQSLSTKLQSVFSGHAAEVQNALQGVGSGWKDQIAGALSEHAKQVTAASQQLSGQLEKIAALEKEITQILKLQEATDAAIKQVSASQEFTSTLSTLRQHLEASDKLLAEAAKPKTIRLVESEG